MVKDVTVFPSTLSVAVLHTSAGGRIALIDAGFAEKWERGARLGAIRRTECVSGVKMHSTATSGAGGG